MDERIGQIEKELALLSMATSDMKKSLMEISHTLKELLKLQTETQLLQQKVNTMDSELRDSFKRVHNRLEEQEKTIKAINNQGCLKNRDNVSSLLSNRKWLVTLVLGAVIMALLGLVVGNYKGSLESENKSLKNQIRHLKKENR